jgi:protein-S-isoprenylcysteine O-methyltransferase Ste14
MTLIMQTARSAVLGLVVLGLIVFLPAGTLAYWQGWVFIIVFTISANTIGLYLLLKDPALLARRLKVGPGAESRPVQKVLIAIALAGTVGVVVVSAFDYRFGWSFLPTWVSVFGDFLVALGLMINLLVVCENSYGAATIEKMEGQTVVSSGPYALMRHPMYGGVLIMLIGVPPALGSWWGLLFLLFFVPILVRRIRDEEAMLRQELDGYMEYTRQVRFRLLPGIW